MVDLPDRLPPEELNAEPGPWREGNGSVTHAVALSLGCNMGDCRATLHGAVADLASLHEGLQTVPAFVASLLQYELLESFVFDVELDDGSKNRLAGFYTINEERLRRLDGKALEHLHRAGHLEPIFMAVASLSHFRDLIERMNRLDAADR